MIRATPANELNDPFELKFSEKQVRQYQENRGIVEDDDELHETIGIIQSDYEDLGIISLSENYSNTCYVVALFKRAYWNCSSIWSFWTWIFFVNEFGSDTLVMLYITGKG